VAGFPPRQSGFEPRSGHVGFFDGQGGTGAGFLRVLWFTISTIPPTAPHSSSGAVLQAK
jgi:hypothetical protein